MKLHLDGAATRIAAYGPGWFSVGERILRHGIVIGADGGVTPWPPVLPSDLDGEHLRRIIAGGPEVVLLGTGARQAFPPPELLRPFVENGLAVEVMDTPAACRTFNVLAAENRKVAAGLLPIVQGFAPRPQGRFTPTDSRPDVDAC